MARAINRSLTSTTLSTCLDANAKAFVPTRGTRRPSASVEVAGTVTGRPSCKAPVKEGQLTGSAPITVTDGLKVFIANDAPAIKPAPPTGIITASTSGTCSTISHPIVPAPAIICG